MKYKYKFLISTAIAAAFLLMFFFLPIYVLDYKGDINKATVYLSMSEILFGGSIKVNNVIFKFDTQGYYLCIPILFILAMFFSFKRNSAIVSYILLTAVFVIELFFVGEIAAGFHSTATEGATAHSGNIWTYFVFMAFNLVAIFLIAYINRKKVDKVVKTNIVTA